MALEKLLTFTKKVADLADKPNATMSAPQVKEYFDAAPTELKLALNKLIDDLQSVVDGNSGADNIKATSVPGLTGDNVQALLESLKLNLDLKANSANTLTKTELQTATDGNSGADKIKATPISNSPDTIQGVLEWLKTQIDQAVLGQFPDASITEEKLAFPVATQAELDAHLNNHTGNTSMHVTADEKATWNGMRTVNTKLVVETRTSDPTTPSVGQIWLRTDL